MCGVRLGQKYYRVGGWWWVQKILDTCIGKMIKFLNTDFNEEKYGGGARI